MKGYRYVITNPEGLHARIAVNLAKICRDCHSIIYSHVCRRQEGGREGSFCSDESICCERG